MRPLLPFIVGFGLWLSLSSHSAAQQLNNDGFHRRNGQMHVLRNGQLRPMTRDSRLPTGVLVTKDGFLVRADGTRTELREGQACDLSGNVVAVKTAAAGGLALGAPAASARRGNDGSPAIEDIREVLADVFGRDREENDDDDNDSGKAWEKRKKQEEKWRKHEKKRREGKKWDD